MVEFRILGPLEAIAEGRHLRLGGVKQRAVLALLLLDPGRTVSADRLLDGLWSGSPPPTATASLQNFVSQLRRTLGQDVIETRAPGYAIRIGAHQLDLVQVRNVVDEARASDPIRRASLLREALATWRGDALEEFADEPFAQGEFARLKEFRLVLTEEWAEAELAVGGHAGLLSDLEALVFQHPLRERLRAQLMLALYRSGQQAAALEIYRQGRNALVSGLGVEPSPLLKRVHAAILRHEAHSPFQRAMPSREHFEEVATALIAGNVTIVVGSNPDPLATELARRFGLDVTTAELARVSQAIEMLNGSGSLYDTLHALLDADADPEPAPVHRFLATFPPELRRRGVGQPLFVTTGYTLALERALEEAGEEFDTVCYVASGPYRGGFCHISPTGHAKPIDPLAKSTDLALRRRPVVLHVQGRVDNSPDRAWESFAITEDDFLHYGDGARRLPVELAVRLRRTHLLLLGYTLSDWTLRVVLDRLWGSEPLAYRSWSVYAGPDPLEREFWKRREVHVIDMVPAAYVAEVARSVENVPR